MTELTPFRLKLGANGYGLVELGDIDVSGMVGAVALDARAGQRATRLVIELLGDVEVEAVGNVTVMRSALDLTEFLEGIDPDELEKEALSRLGWGDKGTTQAILDVLAEKARKQT